MSVGEQALAELSAELHLGDVAEADAGGAQAVAADDDVFHVAHGANEAGAADHGLDAALLDAHGADVAAGGAHRGHELVEGDGLFLEAVGVHVDLVFAHDAAGGGDLGDAGHGAEGGHDDLVEHVAFGLDVARALQGEGVNLAHGGGVGPEFGDDAGGQDALDLGEAFEGAGAVFVEIAAVLEDDVNVAGAVEGEPAHGQYAGQALEFAGEARGDLLVDVGGGLAGPLGPDDDLVVGEVGDGVHRHLSPSPETREGEAEGDGEGDEEVADGEGEHREMTNDQ